MEQILSWAGVRCVFCSGGAREYNCTLPKNEQADEEAREMTCGQRVGRDVERFFAVVKWPDLWSALF